MELQKPDDIEIFDGTKWVDSCMNCGLRGVIQIVKSKIARTLRGIQKENFDLFIWQCSDQRRIMQGNPREIHEGCQRKRRRKDHE